ncbi:N-substituted formamide deformylase precursor [Phycisphaerae bacterium RAS1]|nr:N-substituted formamide deformylase precursor [Phycisphaerae bacterium RAS1]
MESAACKTLYQDHGILPAMCRPHLSPNMLNRLFVRHTATRSSFVRLLALLLLAVLLPTPRLLGQAPPPDTIYVNGNIYTCNAIRPRAEAIAVAGERVAALGTTVEIRRLAPQGVKVVDISGKTVLPGLIDSHGHMSGLGSFGLGRLDLSRATSFDDMVAIAKEKAAATPPGQWILGGRWDHESWRDRRLPSHAALSEATPNHPVFLKRVDGHAGVANAAALKLAGITRDTPSPAGGEILKDASGEPTGVLVDNAMELVAKVINSPEPSTADLLLKAQEMCLSVGLTGVHDAGVSPADVVVYQRLLDEGKLAIRVYAMIAGPYAIRYFEKNDVLVGPTLTVRAAKMYIDGALGSRGAWLLDPYADRPLDDRRQPYTGLSVMKPEFLRMVAENGLQRGYQVCTHAIGDRGNRETLNAYSLVLSRRQRPNHRFRIEHAQVLAPEDIPRFKKLGVVAAMQPSHCTSDMRWAEARLGEKRCKGAYAWASLIRAGVPVAGGSDFPVESHNPFLGFYAAVTRQDAAGQPPSGWQPQERVSRQETLAMYTMWAAYAAFEETEKGSLESGKLADFIVIDRDVMTCEPREILETNVLKTVLGGKVVYSP